MDVDEYYLSAYNVVHNSPVDPALDDPSGEGASHWLVVINCVPFIVLVVSNAASASQLFFFFSPFPLQHHSADWVNATVPYRTIPYRSRSGPVLLRLLHTMGSENAVRLEVRPGQN